MADEPALPDWYDRRFDPYVKAVGRIATMWSHLEFIINQSIWELANVEAGIGACLTAQIIAIGSRTRALIALLDYRGAAVSLLKEFRGLEAKIDGLGRQRNRWVHDPVSLGTETGTLSRIHVTADRRLEFRFNKTDLNEMRDVHLNIRQAAQEFRRLYEKARAELPPWPRTQYEQSPRGIRMD